MIKRNLDGMDNYYLSLLIRDKKKHIQNLEEQIKSMKEFIIDAENEMAYRNK